MSPEQFWPLIQVILVDLMLAADNAIVIGLAAASVPAALRPRVIILGIAAAAALRILFALLKSYWSLFTNCPQAAAISFPLLLRRFTIRF